MNLQDLWSGNDYAWYEDKGRGEVYRSYAKRVKIIRTYKERIVGNTRETGYAEVMMLDDEGSPKEDSQGNHIVRSIRARDVAMRWDEYADLKAHREAQREKLAREQEERDRIEGEMKSKIRELLETKYGIPSEAIGTIAATTVYLNRYVLERELDVEQTA